jgi:uncharacterized membrane protein
MLTVLMAAVFGAAIFIALVTGIALIVLPLLQFENHALLSYFTAAFIFILAAVLYWLIYKAIIKKIFIKNKETNKDDPS